MQVRTARGAERAVEHHPSKPGVSKRASNDIRMLSRAKILYKSNCCFSIPWSFLSFLKRQATSAVPDDAGTCVDDLADKADAGAVLSVG